MTKQTEFKRLLASGCMNARWKLISASANMDRGLFREFNVVCCVQEIKKFVAGVLMTLHMD